MCREVLCLESEIESIKNNNMPGKGAAEPGVSHVLEGKESETENVEINRIGIINNSYADMDDTKVLNSTPKEKKEKVEKDENQDVL